MEIALLGNPNTGKTSLFNHLTNSYEYVGNWSGVTVEKKVGKLKKDNGFLIDLPGVYTLNPLSKDESVVTNFLMNESCQKVINILDASQLERNLHLTIQIMESNKQMIVGLNMTDVAKRRGMHINSQVLSNWLQSPVVPIIARTGAGCDQIEALFTKEIIPPKRNLIYYGAEIEEAVTKVESLVKDQSMNVRWLVLQLFEGNEEIRTFLNEKIGKEKITQLTKVTSERISELHHVTLEDYIYQKRKEIISKIIEDSISYESESTITATEKIDSIVTNKYLGIPIFIALMYIMFMATFDWLGSPLSDLVDGFISGSLTEWIAAALTAIGASTFFEQLILDGIVAGVGGVIVFVPQILILFFFISVLEDSGYMARVALVMDRVMERIGLNGKAFIPMIISFGCNVPGIMAARTIETPKERLMTVLLSPLMSCSARLPVYALFVGAFFTAHQGLIVFSLYFVGIIVAFILAKLFSSTILKGEISFFVIDLPPYRLPQIRALWRSTWDKGKGFVKKAGTFIFAGSIIIWILSNLGSGGWGVEMDNSFLAVIGGVFAPLLAPLGFGLWQAGASLITGFLAKEAVVSAMAIIYHVPDENGLIGLLSQHFTPLSAISFMVFILLYIPCLAATATIYKETNSKKWTAFSIGYPLVVAYVLCLAIYQGGKLLGFS